jgi:LysM repeat protein
MGTASVVVEESVKAAGKGASQAAKRAAKSRKAIGAAKEEPKADPAKYTSEDEAMRINDDSYDSPPTSGSKSAAPAKSTSSSSTASSVADTSPKATRNTAATRAGIATGTVGIIGSLLDNGNNGSSNKPSKSSGGAGGDYKVKKGDTLSQIAKAQGTTVKELLASNSGIKDMNMIKEGMSLKAGKSTPERKSVYDDLKSLTGRGEDTTEKKSGGSLRRSSGGGLGVGQALRGWGAVRKK